ncbi:hypothetical protein LXL04_027423 [Taraxacum kok-saghyz]
MVADAAGLIAVADGVLRKDDRGGADVSREWSAEELDRDPDVIGKCSGIADGCREHLGHAFSQTLGVRQFRERVADHGSGSWARIHYRFWVVMAKLKMAAWRLHATLASTGNKEASYLILVFISSKALELSSKIATNRQKHPVDVGFVPNPNYCFRCVYPVSIPNNWYQSLVEGGRILYYALWLRLSLICHIRNKVDHFVYDRIIYKLGEYNNKHNNRSTPAILQEDDDMGRWYVPSILLAFTISLSFKAFILHGVDEKLSGIILGGSNLPKATPPRDVNFAGGEV